MSSVDVPIDVYDSATELVVIMPLGGVQKDSIDIDLQGLTMLIRGERTFPQLKDTLISTQEHCFWGPFEKRIDLPENANIGQIQSELSPENILSIIVPKVVVPEKIMVKVK